MAPSEPTLTFESTRGGESSPWELREAHRAIWNRLRDFIQHYVSERCEQRIWKNFFAEHVVDANYREGLFSVEADGFGSKVQFQYGFDDRGGTLPIQKRVAIHWFTLAVAARDDEIEAIGAEFDLRFRQPRMELANLLFDNGVDHFFIALDERFYELRGVSSGAAEQTTLIGDHERYEYRELENAIQQRVYDATLNKRCRCTMCGLLRPDPRAEEALTETVQQSSHPAMALGLGILLKQMARPSADVPEALVHAAGHPNPDIARAFVDFAAEAAANVRGDDDQLRELVDRASGAFSDTRRAAALAVALGLSQASPGRHADAMSDLFIEALDDTGLPREYAIRQLGRMCGLSRKLQRRDVVDRLTGLLDGRPGEAETVSALGALIDVYADEGRVPNRVADIFRDHRDHPSAEARQLAEKALEVFEILPRGGSSSRRGSSGRSSNDSWSSGGSSSNSSRSRGGSSSNDSAGSDWVPGDPPPDEVGNDAGSGGSTSDARQSDDSWWRESAIPRHDLARAELTDRFGKSADKLNFFTESPFINESFFRKIADSAAEAAAYWSVIEPETGGMEEAVAIRAEALAAILELATTDADDIEVQFGDAAPASGAVGDDRPDFNAESWTVGFLTAVAAGSAGACRAYMAVEPEDLPVSGPAAGESYAFLMPLLREAWNHRNNPAGANAGIEERIDRRFARPTNPSSGQLAEAITTMKVRLAGHLASGESGSFAEEIAEAVEMHKRHAGRSDEAKYDHDAILPVELIGLASLAWGSGVPVDIETPYLPESLVRGS